MTNLKFIRKKYSLVRLFLFFFFIGPVVFEILVRVQKFILFVFGSSMWEGREKVIG